MTRALVTGSTGFVGANLVAALNARGIEVVALQRETSPQDAIRELQYAPVSGDLLDRESLRRAMVGIDWVFHVAAISDYMHTPTPTIYNVNVDGTRNMLQVAREAGVRRFVFTGSTAALGIPHDGKSLLDETDRFNLAPHIFPYGHSKHLAEELVKAFAMEGLHALSVLPSVVIGPRDLKFISGEIIIQALKGAVPAIPPGGMGYIDVREVAEAHIAAAERGHPGERYILSSHNLSHREAFKIVGQVLGTPVPRFTLPRWTLNPLAIAADALNALGVGLPVNGQRMQLSGEFLYYDNSKATRELGLSIRPFALSICDAYEWYRVNGYLEKAAIRNAAPKRCYDA